MKNSTLELQDELDSYDVDNSLTAVAAYSELKDLKITRKHNISSLAAAKLISNTIFELQSFIAFTPAMTRPTEAGELLRTTYIESLDTLHLFRDILIGMHQDDEGYQDVKIVMDNKENDIFD
jgi:hypothetical protein